MRGAPSRPLAALLVLAGGALLLGACRKPDLACSPGTFFLEITLPPEAASANTLILTVTVAGTPLPSRSFDHPPGSGMGSVEVAFASYPAGQTVNLTLEARDGGHRLATLSRTLDAPAGCAAVTLGPGDAIVVDGGAEDAPIRRDAPPDRAPDTVADVPADRPPTDGAGPDVSSLDGPPRTDGPPCTPRGPEQCFNGVDDDCNGQIDCADPACNPSAQCVRELPSMIGGLLGIPVMTAGCPSGFAMDVQLGTDATTPGCLGCTCTPATPSCSGKVTLYSKQQCADMGAAGQTFDVTSGEPCAGRVYADPQVGGGQASALTFKQAACTPGGMPTHAPARLRGNLHFCLALRRGGGCGMGEICVPKLPMGQAGVCALLEGRQMCPAGAVRTGGDLFAGVQDERTCGPCTCGDPVGGSCANMQVHVGNAMTCDGPNSVVLTPGAPRLCSASGVLLTPGMRLEGTPTPATCNARSEVMGMAQLVGPKTLCCAE